VRLSKQCMNPIKVEIGSVYCSLSVFLKEGESRSIYMSSTIYTTRLLAVHQPGSSSALARHSVVRKLLMCKSGNSGHYYCGGCGDPCRSKSPRDRFAHDLS
jgi:hypothetical protein